MNRNAFKTNRSEGARGGGGRAWFCSSTRKFLVFAGSLAWRCGVWRIVEDVEDVREDVMWAEDGWRMLGDGDGGCGWRMW